MTEEWEARGFLGLSGGNGLLVSVTCGRACMVDFAQISQLVAGNAVFFGVVFLAAGLLIGLAGRAVAAVVLAAGILLTVLVAAARWETQGDLVLEAIILGGGLGISALLALATRWASVAVQFAVFLAAWFLLLRGWMGADFVSQGVGSVLLVVAAGVTTSISARLSRMLPRGARAAVENIRPVR